MLLCLLGNLSVKHRLVHFPLDFYGVKLRFSMKNCGRKLHFSMDFTPPQIHFSMRKAGVTDFPGRGFHPKMRLRSLRAKAKKRQNGGCGSVGRCWRMRGRRGTACAGRKRIMPGRERGFARADGRAAAAKKMQLRLSARKGDEDGERRAFYSRGYCSISWSISAMPRGVAQPRMVSTAVLTKMSRSLRSCKSGLRIRASIPSIRLA